MSLSLLAKSNFTQVRRRFNKLNVIAQNANGPRSCLCECENAQAEEKGRKQNEPPEGETSEHRHYKHPEVERGNNAGELSIVRALKTDGFIRGKTGRKKKTHGGGENVITRRELCGSWTAW